MHVSNLLRKTQARLSVHAFVVVGEDVRPQSGWASVSWIIRVWTHKCALHKWSDSFYVVFTS